MKNLNKSKALMNPLCLSGVAVEKKHPPLFPYRQENLDLVFSFINFSIIIQKTFLLT